MERFTKENEHIRILLSKREISKYAPALKRVLDAAEGRVDIITGLTVENLLNLLKEAEPLLGNTKE